jgi:hypothetical protein
MQLHDVLIALEQYGVLAEPCGEAPTTWHLTLVQSGTDQPYPILEALRLCLPNFDGDYEHEWSETERALIVRER